MVLGYGASRLVCVFLVASRVSAVTTPSPPTIETTGVETTTVSADPMTGTTGEVEMPQVPLTEQVMDLNISVSDVPDVDPELTDVPEATKLQRNRVIRDVAYYIRAHKFRDFDRRYHKSANETTIGFYEDFPKPALRSPHWEVRKHCEASFVQCLNYLERKIQQTVFKREDDTVTVMREQKWSPKIHNEQIQTAQRDCQKALKEDDLTTVPFQGPIGKCIRERFQWRTSVSYYMCWYTMLSTPDLATFGEPCDNHANCLDEFGVNNKDPRADDTKPFACALYSFCPDHCCPMKHMWYMKDCFQSQSNPCYAENPSEQRNCTLNREENRGFEALMANQINVSCECQQSGYEWSSRFGQCVDVNECTRGTHNCTLDVESCMNLPGRHACICRFGNVYDSRAKRCVHSTEIEEILKSGLEEAPSKIAKEPSLLEKIVRVITRSAAGDRSDSVALSSLLIIALTMRL